MGFNTVHWWPIIRSKSPQYILNQLHPFSPVAAMPVSRECPAISGPSALATRSRRTRKTVRHCFFPRNQPSRC